MVFVNILFANTFYIKIFIGGDIILTFNINELLKKQNKSKYWLCHKMDITTRNLNRVIKGETNSISFKYLEDFCEYLDCSLDELITIKK